MATRWIPASFLVPLIESIACVEEVEQEVKLQLMEAAENGQTGKLQELLAA